MVIDQLIVTALRQLHQKSERKISCKLYIQPSDFWLVKKALICVCFQYAGGHPEFRDNFTLRCWGSSAYYLHLCCLVGSSSVVSIDSFPKSLFSWLFSSPDLLDFCSCLFIPIPGLVPLWQRQPFPSFVLRSVSPARTPCELLLICPSSLAPISFLPHPLPLFKTGILLLSVIIIVTIVVSVLFSN